MSNGLEPDELQKLILNSQARDKKKMRVALLVAALLALLLWYTQWPSIRPGLIVLLAGQSVLAGFLFVCSRRLNAPVDQANWFAREAAAHRQAAWLENGFRLLGFMLLGIGFWRSTGNLTLSVALGIVYPAVAYWGFARKRMGPK